METQTPSQKANPAETQSRPRYRLILRILVGIAVLFACFFTLFAFNLNLPFETSIARQRWQQANISSYEIHYVFGSYHSLQEVFVTVTNGTVTNLEQLVIPVVLQSNGRGPAREPAESLPTWYADINGLDRFLPDNLNRYSVEGLLDFWEQREAQISRPLLEVCPFTDERYQVRFNDEYGYIERLTRTNCGYDYDYGLGLMCRVTASCAVGASVVGFKAIEPADE